MNEMPCGNFNQETVERAHADRARAIQAMNRIYTSAYYIDLKTGLFEELTSLDAVNAVIGAVGDARERLSYFCHHMMTPEFTQDMLEFVDLSTLEQRMGSRRILSKQYLSTISADPGHSGAPEWIQCSFIECDRDQEGHLTHVIFTTQTVNEVRRKELEDRRRDQQANQELKALLESERKHTAIIGSLSSIFYALYYVDLTENAMQEIICLDSIHHVYRDSGDARLFLRRVAELLVAPEHLASMALFLDYDTMDTRLGSSRIIAQEFQTNIGDWTRCSIIPVERTDSGRNLSVIVGLRRITDEREARETMNNLILALSMAYTNVYCVNLDTDVSVCYRMDSTMMERYGSRFAAGSYSRNTEAYLRNDVHPDDWHLFEDIASSTRLEAMLADRQSHSFYYRVCRDNRIRYFQCHVVWPNRKRREVAVAFKNVDEELRQELAQQQRVQDALRAEEKANRALQEEMVIVDALSREYHSLFKIDAETGTISLHRTDGVGIDRDLLSRLMKPGDYASVLSAYISRYVIPEDRERILEATSLQSLLQRVPEVGLYKTGYRRDMNGRVAFFEMNVVKTVGDNGKITFILGIRDVDKQTRRQLKLTRQMETQREIIDGLASEYYSVLLVNLWDDRVTAYRAEDEDGRAIAEHFQKTNGCWSKGVYDYAQDWIPEAGRADFLEKLSLERLRRSSENYSFTYEKRTADGVMHLQARVAFVPDKDGGFTAVVGTRNVDDLIKKERQQEMALQAAFDAAEAANRAKTNFLSSMSHDIRTPMNGIIGMTAIAAAHIDDKARVQDSLQKITLASKHLLSLINEVLDMSKIESGKVQLVEEEFNLSDLIDNLISMTGPQIEAHGHSLSVNITGVQHEAVIGDSLRIQKVFTNLMGNAVKFTPDGGKIRITVTEKPCNQKKVGLFEFIFEDNGIGISEDFLDKVFEPFARENDGRVSNVQGTGLGMPISRSIVRMMGGDIKVDSRLGEGSKFTVTMYLKLQEVGEAQTEHWVDLPVLVADDDPFSLESCVSILTDFGMKAEGVATGRGAVERVTRRHREQNDYFACILDWKMPDLDGIAAAREIREAVGDEVPIIIISAYDWSDIEQEARAAGVNAFISKPLFRSRLAKTFHSLTDQEGAVVGKDPTTELEQMDFSGCRALLVEDNALNLEIAAEFLGMTGLKVECARDGIEAVDRLAEVPDGYYDIVFMDIQMPRMNGYDATRAIRAMERNYCRQVPIVAMTANAFAEDVQAAKTVGMNEHIAKPLELSALAKALRKWLR